MGFLNSTHPSFKMLFGTNKILDKITEKNSHLRNNDFPRI